MIHLKPELMQPLREAAAQNDPQQMQSAIQDSLQKAIALEFATIPTYLYAYWSLQPGTPSQKNPTQLNLIHSIVLQEMFHLAIASNILNAVGGSPKIVGAVPTYPGPLPGGVESGVIVPLSPFSLDLVKNVFMVIEEPEDPINFPTTSALTTPIPTLTIGMFYDAISKLIGQAGQGIFTGSQDRQVVMGDAKKITDVASAQAGIETIVTQGEGTTKSPDTEGGELSHFYKFEEISKQATLKKDPNEPLGFSFGPPLSIRFDATGVHPVITNPTASSYAPGSEANDKNTTFNQDFTSMVKHLQTGFTGSPHDIGIAIGTMRKLTRDARALMAISIGNGQYAGPTFTYLP